jgi:hypothetical protein
VTNKNLGVHVTGIPELMRALKATDAEAYKRLRLAMKAIASHVIKKSEQRGAPTDILRPRATQKGAGIAFPKGGPESAGERTGFYPWLDFGGAPRGGRGVTSSSRIAHAKSSGGFRRTYIPEGRYLYPAIGESRDFIADAAYDAIEAAARSKGFEVRG